MTSRALICFDWMAWRTSVKAMFLNVTLARTRSYSLVNTSTILEFDAPPIRPTVRPCRLSMLSMDDPGGAMIMTTKWLTTTTACACDKSPTSPRTTARSALPDENASAASTAVPLSITLSRTGAFAETSSLANCDMAVAASPSIEPTATVSVTGRVKYR